MPSRRCCQILRSDLKLDAEGGICRRKPKSDSVKLLRSNELHVTQNFVFVIVY